MLKMFKLTAIVSLVLIATWSHADLRRNKKDGSPMADFGSVLSPVHASTHHLCFHCGFDAGSTLWAASMPCDSCGSECASACGTRHFRSCCFNYLRKKRNQDTSKLWLQNLHDMKAESALRRKMPVLNDDIPEPWATFLSNDYKPYPIDDNVENRLQLVYDV